MKKPKAYVNGIEVVIYEYEEDSAKCYIPSMNITNWYKLSMIKIDVQEIDKDTLKVNGKIECTSRSEIIQEMKSVINSLYDADKNSFTLALVRSNFGDMVTSLGEGELE